MIKIPTINSFIRFLHASPGIGALNIYYNGNLSIEDLDYREMSKFLVTEPDNNNVQVFPGDDNENAIVDTSVYIPPSEIVNLAIIGTIPNTDILPIIQGLQNVDPQEVRVRFAHLSEDAPRLDINLADGNGGFSDVGYKEVTDYITVTPDTYTLEVRQAGEEEPVLTTESLVLKGGKAYTAYAVGLLNDSPSLEIICYEDGAATIDDNKWVTEKISSPMNNSIRINFRYC